MTINSIINDLQNTSADKASYFYPFNAVTANVGVVTNSSSIFALGTTDFSVLINMKLDLTTNTTGSDEYIFGINGGVFIGAARRYATPTTLSLYHAGAWIDTGYVINSTEFMSFLMIRTGGYLYVYINGLQVYNLSSAASNMSGTPLFSIGSHPSALGNHIIGNISRALLFNYSLDNNKIKRYTDGSKLTYEDVGGSMTTLSSGLLIIGKRYRITASGGTFTGVGAANNNVGTEFTATGTTPTWGTGTVIQLGAVLDLEPENITDTTWFDASPNGLHGIVTGAIATRFIPSYSSRNYVINGGMDFWQRGTSFSVTSATYTADRFYVPTLAGNQTATQVTGDSPSNSLYVLQHSRTSSSSSSQLHHRIESSNIAKLKNKVVTISFYVKRTVGVLPLNFRISTADALDNFSTTTTVKEWEITNISSSWQLVSFTTTLPANTTNGVLLLWYAATDSNGFTFRLTDVMLNEGSVAAPFERAGGSIGGELALCQRYYEKSYDVNIAPGNTSNPQGAFTFTSRSADQLDRITVPYLTTKRVNDPTVTLYRTGDGVTGSWQNIGGGSTITASIVTGTNGTNNYVTYPTQNTTANVIYRWHWTSEDEL